MSDIKSTIDLIMERTRGLTLSDKEREDLHAEELLKKAKGLKLKITDNPDGAAEILELSDLLSQEDKDFVKGKLWEQLLQDIPQDESVFNYLRMLEKIPLAQPRLPIIDQMRHELRNVTKDSAADKKKILNREKKKLADSGISGSAVVPKLPKDVVLSDEFVGVVEKYRVELTR